VEVVCVVGLPHTGARLVYEYLRLIFIVITCGLVLMARTGVIVAVTEAFATIDDVREKMSECTSSTSIHKIPPRVPGLGDLKMMVQRSP
jgi:hypothetical protein